MHHFRLVKMEDASNPNALKNVSGAAIVAGYIGGDTPHVWSDDDWHRSEFNSKKKIPIFVRSNDVGTAGGRSDGFLALEQLYHLGVPHHTIVVYDRETNTDIEATRAFNSVLIWGSYRPVPYGSKDNLFAHPAPYGYWVADYTNKPHIYDHPGVEITQWTDAGPDFDLSEVKFWVYEQWMQTW
jgi:hypothetical protein